MTTLELLRAARALISDPAHWHTGPAAALDTDGRRIVPTGPAAVTWSAFGALWRFENQADEDTQEAAYQAVTAGIPGFQSGVSYLDDYTPTHADALALYDVAIARLESEARP